MPGRLRTSVLACQAEWSLSDVCVEKQPDRSLSSQQVGAKKGSGRRAVKKKKKTGRAGVGGVGGGCRGGGEKDVELRRKRRERHTDLVVTRSQSRQTGLCKMRNGEWGWGVKGREEGREFV